MTISSRRLSALSVLLCAVIGVAAWNSAASARSQLAVRGVLLAPAAKSFPLWSLLPSKSFAVLAEGALKERRWGAFTFRRQGSSERDSPCVQIVSLRDERKLGQGFAVFSANAACSRITAPTTVPVMSEVTYGAIGASAIAIMVHPSVTRIVFEQENGEELSRLTKRLSSGQASKAKVSRFRFLAFATTDEFCYSNIFGYDASGLLVFQSSRADCTQ